VFKFECNKAIVFPLPEHPAMKAYRGCRGKDPHVQTLFTQDMQRIGLSC